MDIQLFHCEIHNADIRVEVCKKRRENLMFHKLKYIMDPYERCGVCKQALNVDNGDIEVFTISYVIDTNIVPAQEGHLTSVFSLPAVPRVKGKKRQPMRILQSPNVKKKQKSKERS